MKKYILLLTLFLTGCGPSLEYLVVPNEEAGWKLAYQHREQFTNSNLSEFIPGNDSIDNWSKLLTIQYINAKSNVTPHEFVSSVVASAQKVCSDTTWKSIEESSRSILYEKVTKSCPAPQGKSDPNIYTPQTEIARVIFGNEGIHKASYTIKQADINPILREEWINNLKRTNLEKDGKPIELL